MKYIEEKGDLFSSGDEYWYAQCISEDFGMGKGIAVEFNKRFDQKCRMMDRFGDRYLIEWHSLKLSGDAIADTDIHVLNLVTKTNYWEKPTYTSLRAALIAVKGLIKDYDIKKIAMPKIGCGLDRLIWYEVKQIILEVFKDIDIEILVKYL